jgi:hypothetical protein
VFVTMIDSTSCELVCMLLQLCLAFQRARWVHVDTEAEGRHGLARRLATVEKTERPKKSLVQSQNTNNKTIIIPCPKTTLVTLALSLSLCSFPLSLSLLIARVHANVSLHPVIVCQGHELSLSLLSLSCLFASSLPLHSLSLAPVRSRQMNQ